MGQLVADRDRAESDAYTARTAVEDAAKLAEARAMEAEDRAQAASEAAGKLHDSVTYYRRRVLML